VDNSLTSDVSKKFKSLEISAPLIWHDFAYILCDGIYRAIGEDVGQGFSLAKN